MNLEQYLVAVSAAIEDHETLMGEAFEHHANAMRNRTATDQLTTDALDAVFMAKLGASYLAMLDRVNNLRKWPRT